MGDKCEISMLRGRKAPRAIGLVVWFLFWVQEVPGSIPGPPFFIIIFWLLFDNIQPLESKEFLLAFKYWKFNLHETIIIIAELSLQ